MRRGWVIAGVIVIVAVGTAVAIQRRTTALWPQLRMAEERFAVATQFTRDARREVGSTLCVVSCNEARIESSYRTVGLSEDEVRARTRAAMRRVFGEALSPVPNGQTGELYAALHEVRRGAWLVVRGTLCEHAAVEICTIVTTFSSGLE